MKKSLKRTFGYAVGVFAVALFAFSCANPLSPTLPIDSTGAKTLVNGVETFTLWAGQHIDAGRVSVWRDASKLYVKYETNSSFTIDQTHVWVGSSLSDLPVNNLGVPAPGQFPSVIGSYAAGTKTATISFSFLPSWEGKSLYIFSHAALLSTQYGNQTGWAGDNSLNISRWNFYMNVVPPTIVPVDPEDPEEPEVPLTYTISGFVFHDLDSDGVKDDGEPGLSGVQVSLAGGASALSGSDGAYSFAGLAAGSYTVNSGNLAGFFPTPYDLPTVSRTVSLPESKTGVNFGLSYESISGRAFRDSNANGAFDSGEEGLAGVRLALSGAATGSVMSGPDGSYLFDHLKGGSSLYTVAAGDVAGEYHTPYAAPFVSWTGSASASGVDFGYSHESVSGVVFYDANRNDVYDAGEPLLSGFGVRLNTGASAVSGSDGSYLFDNLIGGSSYTVSANDKEGFVHSVAVSRTVFPANAVPAKADFGFAVDYSWIPGKLANGFTI
ncbi:MAG TPA: SdrD B-like domain-containing protein [Rectinemataceae bacterium]